MAKRIVLDYTFDATANTIVLDGIYRPERVLLITNVTDGVNIYQFNSTTKKINSVSYDYDAGTTTVVLNYDTSSMSNTDSIQVFVEEDEQQFRPSQTYTDPVSKFRVSQPENLIDTDFEYGLQSTKWETLELVKNIPTFFSRSGEVSFDITSISTINGSDTVTVVTVTDHGFAVGSPIIIQGSRSITCDGSFIVTSVTSTTEFTYKAKAIQGFTGSIKDTYTALYPASVYQGTEFRLSTLNSIVTDGAANSTITVTTETPTDFIANTSMFLVSSVGAAEFNFDAANTIANNYNSVQVSSNNNVATGESGFALGATQIYDYTGADGGYYFNSSDVTVSTGSDFIETPTAHGLSDNLPYLYVVGEGNGVIGGLTDYRGYYVRTINATAFYLTTTQSSTTRVDLSSSGSNAGVYNSAFLRAYQVASTTAGTTDSVNFSQAHNLTNLSFTPMLFFGGTVGGIYSASSNLKSGGYTIYYSEDVLNTTQIRVSFTSGGANPTNVAAVNHGGAASIIYMVKLSLLATRSSVWFANHGLSTDNVILFTTDGATPPGGLANNTNYKAEIVDSNRIRFKNNDTGAVIILSSIGTTNQRMTIETRTANFNNDTLYFPNNNFTDQLQVTYDENTANTIGGLSNGSIYYIFTRTADRVRLANTAAGWSTNNISFNQATGINTTTNIITTGTHGISNGQAALYTSGTPAGGLTSGQFYWASAPSSTTIKLHWSQSGATSDSDVVDLTTPITGTGIIRGANLVDITSANTGTQKLISTVVGSSDGVYSISNVTSNTSFELSTNITIGERSFLISGNSSIDLSRDAFNSNAHFLQTGTSVTYTTTGDPIGGLANNTVYYVIRQSRNWFKLANTVANAIDSQPITLANTGTGTHLLSTSSIGGEILGAGTLTIANNSTRIVGTGTNFTASFSPGDQLIVYSDPTTATKTVSAINTTTDVLTSNGHGLVDGNPVIMSATSPPGGTSNGTYYYVRTTGSGAVTNNFTLHTTYNDAIAGTSNVDLTTAGSGVSLIHQSSIGSATTYDIRYVNSQTRMQLSSNNTTAFSGASYATGTALLVRADGFALHRPYDGGVELVPSKNPDSSMIRQTRKYFRYQSGKGIQVSFAINFKPSIQIESYTASGNTATLTTRFPHRLSEGLDVVISGATVTSGTNPYNGTFEIQTVPNDYTFTIELPSTPIDTVAGGLSQFYVDSWQNSALRCGLFDDQNGMFFEFDGQNLYVVRRNSTTQLSGTVSVTFKSGTVIGTGTKFSSQLAKGDSIVIKGQTYLITNIASDTQLSIMPSYRGVSFEGAIAAKTIDLKFPQTSWNLDKCDGTGPSGFLLDKSKIQMAYMDYSWYGAGKVRFGFKDQHGDVFYVHEIVHGNREVEAYLRSGNLPARYETKNTGQPTYVPSLAHWGTSVIMDGRFDDDKAYIFTAASNPFSIFSVAQANTSGRTETTAQYWVFSNGRYRLANYGIQLAAPNSALNAISAGLVITGANLASETVTANPVETNITPFQPYLGGVSSRIGTSTNNASTATRSLLLIDKPPVATATANTTYTITLGATDLSITGDYALISIRLAPSVDSGSPGLLGERDIINRMQLILNSVGIVSTHTAEISLVLNPTLDNSNWQRVQNPSLSQLIYHETSDTVNGGVKIYTFRAEGGAEVTTGARSPSITTVDLGEVATLGNSILGGDGTYPDGPDVLTIIAKLAEDVSKVTATNPFNISARVSWSESQA